MSVLPEIADLRRRVGLDMIGQEEIINLILMGLLVDGHILVEGLPGLAKTRAIKSLANNIEAAFKRIQFTPDLVSSDITGKQVYYEGEGGGRGMYQFEPGAIFANLVLADEINRAPAKVQNSLLEAMAERQVTVSGQSYPMEKLFLVMATQNPVDQEGTYPLPEAQKDRFMMHVTVNYPDEEAERDIIRLIRNEESQKERAKRAKEEKAGGAKDRVITKAETIFKARAEIDEIVVPEYIEKYIVDIIFATRYPQKYTFELRTFIAVGASPRASIALDKVSRAHAWLKGRKEVTPEDVQAMASSVLRHRLVRGDRAIEHRITTDDIVEEIFELMGEPDPEMKGKQEVKSAYSHLTSANKESAADPTKADAKADEADQTDQDAAAES